jgi:DNA adenine methylase
VEKLVNFMKLRNIAPNSMEVPLRPFLKWAGAKRQLIHKLGSLFPEGDYRFIEPFVGSGVVFLNTRYRSSLLSDSNKDIIDLYLVLKEKPEEFIRRCKKLFTPANNSEETFYELREEFNLCTDDVEHRAALFLYLNRHCFNGLCRYNQKGRFNTPFGRYEQVYFPETEMSAFARKLELANLRQADFRKVLSKAGSGDVVYCDPPYVPLTSTANFTSYAAGGFSAKDQEALTDLAVEASGRGAVVVVSNHDTPVTRKLYSQATLTEVMVSRTISCDGKNRNKAKEIIAVFNGSRSTQLQVSS